MALPTPYRSLPVDRRISLLSHDLKHNRDSRPEYIRRLVARGGGFRPETIRKWPIDQLAREIVRRNLETLPEEFGLLQLLYVELEPEIQITFCDAAGVSHQNGLIAEDLPAPFANADAVKRGVDAVRSQHGANGEHYLNTIALYNGEAWPGLAALLEAGS